MSRPKKVYKLHPSQVAKKAREGIGHLSKVEAAAPTLARVNDWVDDARRGTSFEGVRRGGAQGSDPEMRAVRPRMDPATATVSTFVNATLQAEAWARICFDALVCSVKWAEAADRAGFSLSLTESRLDGPQRGAGEGECKVCTRYVPGLPNDRLRSGRCNPCRVWFDRHGSERPREQWTEDEEAA